jgi:hypothetical protein
MLTAVLPGPVPTSLGDASRAARWAICAEGRSRGSAMPSTASTPSGRVLLFLGLRSRGCSADAVSGALHRRQRQRLRFAEVRARILKSLPFGGRDPAPPVRRRGCLVTHRAEAPAEPSLSPEGIDEISIDAAPGGACGKAHP